MDGKIKEALRAYFSRFDMIADEDLPSIPIPDGATPEIFVGQEKDGWIQWRPREKEEIFDLSELEDKADVIIHQSVKEFLNSWWFGYLQIEINGFDFNIHPIIPGNYKPAFLVRLLGYRTAHQGKLTHIPIGMSYSSEHLLVIENATGQVQAEDFSNHEFHVIAQSLEEFLLRGN